MVDVGRDHPVPPGKRKPFVPPAPSGRIPQWLRQAKYNIEHGSESIPALPREELRGRIPTVELENKERLNRFERR